MTTFNKLSQRKQKVLDAVCTIPEQFRAECAGGYLVKSFTTGATYGAAIAGLGLLTKSMGTPYVEQSGTLGIPETLIGIGTFLTVKDLAKKAHKVSDRFNTPVSTRSGIFAGALSTGLMTLPLHDDFNALMANTIHKSSYSPEIAAQFITDKKNAATLKIWEMTCPYVQDAITASDQRFTPVECP